MSALNLIAYYILFCNQEVITVPEIVDDQPRNPFTEIQLLTAHSDIVNLLTHIDDRR